MNLLTWKDIDPSEYTRGCKAGQKHALKKLNGKHKGSNLTELTRLQFIRTPYDAGYTDGNNDMYHTFEEPQKCSRK